MTIISLHRAAVSGHGDAAMGHVPSRRVPPPVDEAELARQLAAGDAAALTAIADWLWEPLAAYAYRIVEDRDAAMDIAQEACVRLWQGRGRGVPRSLRAYLYRVTRNLALDHVKTIRGRRRLLKQHDASAPGPAEPDEVLENERTSQRVQHAIQALPERRREVFVLAYLRGLKYAEIAEVMGVSAKTVQNHMTAALAQLRHDLRALLDERRAEDREAEGRKGNGA